MKTYSEILILLFLYRALYTRARLAAGQRGIIKSTFLTFSLVISCIFLYTMATRRFLSKNSSGSFYAKLKKKSSIKTNACRREKYYCEMSYERKTIVINFLTF